MNRFSQNKGWTLWGIIWAWVVIVMFIIVIAALIPGCTGGRTILWDDPFRPRTRIFPICPPDDYVCEVIGTKIHHSLSCHPENWKFKRFRRRYSTPKYYDISYAWWQKPASYICPDGVERFDPLGDRGWTAWCLKYGARLEDSNDD